MRRKKAIKQNGKIQEKPSAVSEKFRNPYDDNMSERSLRKVNSRQKMAGKFLKASGAKMFCKILSIIETPKKENATDVKNQNNI